MIYGIGTDIVEVQRLREAMTRHPDSFARRTFTPAELLLAARQSAPEQFYAGRWAAKEAIAKALGVGFGKHCNWLDIDISNDELGRPHIALSGTACAFAAEHGIDAIHLTISHEKTYAVAMAVAERSSS